MRAGGVVANGDQSWPDWPSDVIEMALKICWVSDAPMFARRPLGDVGDERDEVVGLAGDGVGTLRAAEDTGLGGDLGVAGPVAERDHTTPVDGDHPGLDVDPIGEVEPLRGEEAPRG